MFCVGYFSELVSCSVSATFQCWFHVLCRLLFRVGFMFCVGYFSMFQVSCTKSEFVAFHLVSATPRCLLRFVFYVGYSSVFVAHPMFCVVSLSDCFMSVVCQPVLSFVVC